MLQITAEMVLSELSRRKGRDKGIHIAALVVSLTGERSCQARERTVRKLVNELRLEGHPVCAHPADGYYLATTVEEIESTCNFLRSRAMSSLNAEARLRSIPVAELLGSIQTATTDEGL